MNITPSLEPSAVIGKIGGGLHDDEGEVTVASVDTPERNQSVIDGESVLETIQREAQEKCARRASGTQLIRRLKQTRAADLTVNFKVRLDWQEHDDSTCELVIGQDKHRILLVDRHAGWRSLSVDPFSKQARLSQALRQRRLGDAHLRRGLILDREFAAVDRERKRHLAGKPEQAASRNKSGRGMA
jgi:hypothetical protein